MKKILIVLAVLFVFVLLAGYVFYSWLNKNAFEGTASASNIKQEFEIKEGEGSKVIG